MSFNAYYNDYIDNMIFTEASVDDSFLVRDELYNKVEKVLSTDMGKRQFSNIVSKYVNANSEKLSTVGPLYKLVFGTNDKENYYKLFGVNEVEIKTLITKVVSKMNDKARWALIKQNPFFVLIFCIVRYFTIKKDAKMLNNALIITALAFYPSMFVKYFPFEPNAAVMQYTIDNLSDRFTIKKSKHIFGTLTTSVQSSWKYFEKDFAVGSDTTCVRFIQRVRNDQNSLLKRIAKQYYDNHKKGLRVQISQDDIDTTDIVDRENDSNKAEGVSNAILIRILTNGVDLKLCDFASNVGGVSKLDMRNYITKIVIEQNKDEMKDLIDAILFNFIYTEKHKIEELHSKMFIEFSLKLFKKTNSLDPNIGTIKRILAEWGDYTGVFKKFNREATRVSYSKAFYMYFVMSIQKYA